MSRNTKSPRENRPGREDSSPSEKQVETLPRIKTRSRSSVGNVSRNFDKYYIHPERRYKVKLQNPKQNPDNYEDETFVYKNLHNINFWNWVHPLDDYELKPPRNTIASRVNIPVLEKFKRYLESKTGKRVPLVVKEIFNGDI